MKKIGSLVLSCMICMFFGQTTTVEYDFKVNIYQPYVFPAKLSLGTNGNVKYTVLYGIAGQVKNSGAYGNSLVDRSYYEYILFTNKQNPYYIIKDKISRKEYVFKDTKHKIQYVHKNDKKEVDGKLLSSVTTEFRGRKYTIWYDAQSKIKTGPWKFSSPPGLVYEAYDDTGTYRWELKSVNKSKEIVKNTIDSHDFLAYTEYPILKYGLLSQFKKDGSTDHNTRIEQDRTSLETKFEWEN